MVAYKRKDVWNMKRIYTALFMVLFLEITQVSAEMESSGFVDFLYRDQQQTNSTFGIGSFELDLASELSPNACFEGAVVVEGDTVGLGQTIIDFKLVKEGKLGLQIGLIDVPFGIDYQVFAAPDRELISVPLVTELMMDGGWADVGINLYGSYAGINCNLYIVNGMGEENGGPVSQLADNNNCRSAGTRVGILPLKGLELGFSYAWGPYLNDNTEHILSRIGYDIQCFYSIFKIKGEYAIGNEDIPLSSANKHEGYYIQLLVDISEKLYGVLRYGGWKPKSGSEMTRITTGLGHAVADNISLRAEYQINNENPEYYNNLFGFQTVVSF
jgi:hypothetical protein